MHVLATATAIAAALVLAASVAAASGVPPVASLWTLPPPTTLPPQYPSSVSGLATSVGINRALALRRTRLLRTDVTGLPLYAFSGTRSRICFTLWPGGGTCGQISASHTIVWIVNGGGGKRAPAVVGVVSDRVRAVEVTILGKRVRASVRHNAFVVPFHAPVRKHLPLPVVRPVTR
jgi:hypothetical protein